MATVAGKIVPRLAIVGIDHPQFQVSASRYNDSLIVTSSAPDGYVLAKDSTQADGWGFAAQTGGGGATLAIGSAVGGSSAGAVLFVDGAKNLANVAGAAGTIVIGGVTPSFSAIPTLGVATSVAGTIGLANAAAGGNVWTLASAATAAWTLTGMATAPAQGDLFTFSNATGQMATVADVAVNQVLTSGGVGAVPTYSATPVVTSITLSGQTLGSVLYVGAAGLVSGDNAHLFYDATGHVLWVGAAGAPSGWPTPSVFLGIYNAGTAAATLVGDGVGANANFNFYSYGGTPNFITVAVGGSMAIPAATATAKVLGQWQAGGWTTGLAVGGRIIFTTTEQWASGHAGTKLTFQTAAIGSTTATQRFQLDENGYTHAGAEIDSSYVYSAPASGATITMSAAQARALIDPAGTIAALTVTLPPTPVDGQIAGMAFTQIVTALTINAPGGATVVGPPTSAAVNSAFRFQYRSATTSWYPAA